MDRKEAIRRSVRKELYALARRWGSKAVLVTQDEGTFDEKTGANVATIARQMPIRTLPMVGSMRSVTDLQS